MIGSIRNGCLIYPIIRVWKPGRGKPCPYDIGNAQTQFVTTRIRIYPNRSDSIVGDRQSPLQGGLI
ncbi:hypothetical protein QNI19_37475 [Cytophagaceae bacterium DM2B3-1]|uniref:Uncharacterized protein n=1 Tax=Xanthocytophaga flava TaxID=3048013 RepID=A0ABT7D1M5_9BACT|nr:hypothetical protein [Xanthocytophaga flavus]MDJ1498684.1 hypothetical protein [Xanthocytophaga flavus]